MVLAKSNQKPRKIVNAFGTSSSNRNLQSGIPFEHCMLHTLPHISHISSSPRFTSTCCIYLNVPYALFNFSVPYTMHPARIPHLLISPRDSYDAFSFSAASSLRITFVLAVTSASKALSSATFVNALTRPRKSPNNSVSA